MGVATSRLGQGFDLDTIDRLELALGLAGLARLSAKAVCEGLVFSDPSLALLVFFFSSLALFDLGTDKCLIVSGICFRSGVVDVHDDRGHIVQKPVVVGNHQGRATELIEKTFEPANRENVEMVRRFIQEQNVWIRCEYLGQQDPQLESTRESGKRLLMNLGFYT